MYDYKTARKNQTRIFFRIQGEELLDKTLKVQSIKGKIDKYRKFKKFSL